MENNRYELTSAFINVCEDVEIECYGIRCIRDEQTVADYKDVLPDREKVANLVKLCNELDLAPHQLPEVLEDFLP